MVPLVCKFKPTGSVFQVVFVDEQFETLAVRHFKGQCRDFNVVFLVAVEVGVNNVASQDFEEDVGQVELVTFIDYFRCLVGLS